MRILGLVLLFISGCSASTALEVCETHNFPYEGIPEGLPVCHWHIEQYGCETFEDYNSDGTRNMQDLYDFCQYERDGDTLTTCVDNVLIDWDTPRVGCYACD